MAGVSSGGGGMSNSSSAASSNKAGDNTLGGIKFGSFKSSEGGSATNYTIVAIAVLAVVAFLMLRRK